MESTFWERLSQHIRLVDVLDIILAALFIYILITWVRESTRRSGARRVLVSMAFLLLLFAAARQFELFLIEALVQVLLVVLLLGAVVVFQTDIRRLVDRLGALRFFRRSSQERPAAGTVEMLTDAAARMADMKRGALIAIQGEDPWDRYLESGVLLEGRASLPLLISIFNPSSPGHDGAVLFEGETCTRFSVHLPLSTRLPGRLGGTRHAAALGLAEQCDAFVIVVSEERGTISIAEAGTLEEMETPSALKERLSAFWERHYGGASGATPGWWRRHSLQTALVSLALATVLWFSFAYRPDTVTRAYTIPIEYRNLPAELTLGDSLATEVRVTLSGSEQDFRTLNANALLVSLDLAEVEAGQTQVVISDDQLQLPNGIELDEVAPRTVDFTTYRLRPFRVPVEVPTTGALPDSLALVQVQPVPDSLTILVREDMEQVPATVKTETVDLSQITVTTALERQFIPPDQGRLSDDQPSAATVHVMVRANGPSAGRDAP